MATSIATGTQKDGWTGAGSGNGPGEGGNGGGPLRSPAPSDTHQLGVFFGLAGIAMLFVALTSAYVVRRGLGDDWQAIRMPWIVLVNTLVLLASSLTLEKARRKLETVAGRAMLRATLLGGAVFVAGQFEAWRMLSARGLYLSTNPHSSFFYVLTGLHACHVIGGMAALGYLEFRARRREDLQRVEHWLEGTALYWHFMGGLWVYLLVLLART